MTDVIRKSRSWRVVVPTLLLLGVGYCILWPDLNDRIRRDLEDKVSGGAGNTIVGNYDFVCFSAVTGRAVAEFEPILTRKDPRYADTASSCGVNRTCCDLDSDRDYIGLAKDGRIECVAFRSMLLTEPDKTLCIPPAKICVTKEVFQSRYLSTNRAWTSEPGRPYLKISEQQ